VKRYNPNRMTKYIPSDILKRFLNSYEKGDIWQVHQLNEKWLIVFLYFDKQMESNKNLPLYQAMKDEYLKLAKQYLDVPFDSPNNISIKFDSKENFESKYGGNWYHYYH
jgi:hypothetical protein